MICARWSTRSRWRLSSSGRSRPTIRVCAARPRTRMSSSRRARRPVPSMRRCRACSRRQCFASRDRTGRSYRPFEYVGHPEAERVLVAMGSATATIEAAVRRLNAEGERVGLVTVRLYRPFSSRHLAAVLPFSTRAVAVLDRAKDSAAVGEPLYEDVVSALHEEGRLPPTVIGGRYGLGSKEFTPAMAAAVFEELAQAQSHDREKVHRDLDVRPHRHFTVGIDDDVSGTSLPTTRPGGLRGQDVNCLFYGLGSDGTVGANKNSAKIIADRGRALRAGLLRLRLEEVGGRNRLPSALRRRSDRGPLPDRGGRLRRLPPVPAARPCRRARAERGPARRSCCHSPYGLDTWRRLPRSAQEQITRKQLRLFVVDAKRVAREAGLPGRVNSVLQTCFFSLSGVLPVEEAIAAIKRAIEKTYSRKGEEVVRRNFAAVDGALAALQEIEPGKLNGAPPYDLHADAPLVPAGSARRPRRRAAGLRLRSGRCLPDRHRPLRAARARRRAARLGSLDLHRLRQVHARLPARGDPHEGLRARAARSGARRLQEQALAGARICRASSWRSPSPRSTARAASYA